MRFHCIQAVLIWFLFLGPHMWKANTFPGFSVLLQYLNIQYIIYRIFKNEWFLFNQAREQEQKEKMTHGGFEDTLHLCGWRKKGNKIENAEMENEEKDGFYLSFRRRCCFCVAEFHKAAYGCRVTSIWSGHYAPRSPSVSASTLRINR